ncbi:hypothetical protein SAMN04515620_11110 [Collimonas sp. OK607]|uniref:hypothetical protein n=1 Tax=Collimonas sp. OK607 TaxID=1798194 RepID=UPI0008F02854|nr:hypothetical protein [Collimonas sp. OK607]SFA98678.1 hypothetical protein SAMN04515620_11110 [Collimonas sp. OK607]
MIYMFFGMVVLVFNLLFWLFAPSANADEVPLDVPEVPVKVVAKPKPKEETLRVEKVSRALSDQTMKRDQLLAYLASKRSYAERGGCEADGFLTCQGQGARIEGSPSKTDEGRYRPRPGTIRDYHE